MGETQRVIEADAARVSLSGTPRVIGPPLRSADWLAANGPSNSSGHRRTIVPVDGTGRIAQRFAIDWIQLRPREPARRRSQGRQKLPRLWTGRVGCRRRVVSAVKDGIPENIPGATSRAVPITL